MLATAKNQAVLLWKKQSNPQRITLLALIGAGLILVPVLLFWANRPSYAIAYKGLSEADAGQIVQKLDDEKISYTLQDNGTISVPSDQVYKVRLIMARDGLPQSSTAGYELLDQNTLGLTDFLQRVNYQRALEGELERTIGSMSAVAQVRVHIVTPEKSLLTSDQEPATSSVTLKVKQGQILDAAQVRAITNLVASSVEALKPENVVVVDTDGNLLSGPSEDASATSLGQSSDQRAAEVAASNEVKKRVQAILDKVLGPNRYVAQASVQLDWTQKEITSDVYDPTPAAVRSSHTLNESYNNVSNGAGGVPGAGSNLPTPLPTIVATAGPGAYNHSEQTVNYEISQTQTHEKITPGQVKKISVSVMVDKVTDAAQIASIKSAVAAAAGVDVNRGDQIVVESIGFDRSYYDAQSADLKQSEQQNLYVQLGIGAACVLLLVMVLAYFLRSLRRLRTRSEVGWRPVLRPVAELTGAQNRQFPAGQPANHTGEAKAENTKQKTDQELLAEISSRVGGQASVEDEQKVRIIQRLTEENPTTVAEIIQIWLSEDERKNG
jgi:flagellar M-ring protein FliF